MRSGPGAAAPSRLTQEEQAVSRFVSQALLLQLLLDLFVGLASFFLIDALVFCGLAVAQAAHACPLAGTPGAVRNLHKKQ